MQNIYTEDMVTMLDIMIAEYQRELDFMERFAGYDALPSAMMILNPVNGTDYKLPPFENGAIINWIHFSFDQAANVTDFFLYHPSITEPQQKHLIVRQQFSGAAAFTRPTRVIVPAGGQLGFATQSGTATYSLLSVGWTETEQTNIEWQRLRRAGRQ